MAPQDSKVQRDAEGFLLDMANWNEAVAAEIANEHHIQLEAPHWELIVLIRRFYQEFDLSPAMRPLIKYAGRHLQPEKANSLYFLGLFPGSPAKLLAKIAGLPKPANCL